MVPKSTMFKRFLLAGLFIFSLVGGATVAQATVALPLAAWDTYGQPGDQTATPGVGSENVDALDMVRGAGLDPSAASNSFSSKGWDGTDANDYIEFGFSVAAGYQANLDELWIGTRSSSTGPGTMGVYTSLDGFSNPIYTITQCDTAYSNSIISLNGLEGVVGDFYIRLMEIGNTQADGSGDTYSGGTFRVVDHYDSGIYTDTSIFGSVEPIAAVPVPAAVWLFGSGLLGLVGIHRRKQ